MAVLPIRVFGDPVLREFCPEVKEIDESVEALVRDLTDSLPRPGGAGLSANQVGVLKRVFVFEDQGEVRACINPLLVSVSEETEEELEGCLSLPGVAVPVTRHLAVVMEFQELDGSTRRLEVKGWLARVFQHEIDHLEGKLILDRTDRESRVQAIQYLQGDAVRHDG